MSQIDYYNNHDPALALPHRAGIKGWGIFVIVLGVLSLCAVGLQILGFIASSVFAPKHATTVPLAILIGGAINLLIVGSIFIWLGAGLTSIRRWAHSLIVAGSVVYLFRGLLAVPSMITTALILGHHPVASRASTVPISPAIRVVGATVGVVFGFLFAFFLPALLLWFYGRPSVRADFEHFDANPVWTDRCPMPVLIFCAHSATALMQIIPVAFVGVATVFSLIYIGPLAYLVLALQAVWFLAMTYLCFRRKLLGWLLALAMTVYTCVSNVSFLLYGNAAKLSDQMHTTAVTFSQADASHIVRDGLVWQTVLEILIVIYLLWLYRYFKPQPPLTTAVAV